jgi:cobalt-zinc-cadmium efflux system protein
MGHAHAHGPGHLHLHTGASAGRGRLGVALGLILALMAAEVVVGLLASSLALLSDAGHMLTDAAALGLAIVAARLATRPPSGAMTYGLGRVEALSAMANGVTLGVLGLWFIGTAIARLVDPPDVEGGLVLAVALIGIVVNLAATWVLAGARTGSLNVEGAFQHVLTDLYAFIATAVAAVVILASGFDRADPLAALVVAALMLRAAVALVRASGRVVLEGSPEGLDPDQIGHALAARPHVVEVHDLHVWELGTGFPALSAHVTVEADCDCHAVRTELAALLRERFAIEHATLQVDHDRPSQLLRIETS